ncbi:MAG: hypothetical protein DRH57_08500 [Candidatus Cloacimonadota bacterium]|nr:MAG: hypothetical protein DRH57_08500 [Candidatus Cloacimonadota bacterium]
MNLKKDFNEGLGTVYERFIINYIFDRLMEQFEIKEVLEYPIFGMTGIDGINSVHLAKKSVNVTLVDFDKDRMEKVRNHWKILKLESKLRSFIADRHKVDYLPFQNETFDIVWNFAALWFFKDADKIINKMIDLSRNIVFISVNNKWQIGYPIRKYLLDRQFFVKNTVFTEWINISKIKKILKNRGLTIIEDGVFDTPPWPDTCLPINEIKKKLGIKIKENHNNSWVWSMMAYYAEEDKELEEKCKKVMFIENLPIWWRLKQFWSHHRYVIARKD